MEETMLKNWTRVTRHNHCPVCDKPDWCLVHNEKDWAICMRVEAPQKALNSLGGWFHRLREERRSRPKPRPLETKHKDFSNWIDGRPPTEDDANPLGVSLFSLNALGCRRLAGCLAFPMFNDSGTVIGVRTRLDTGEKRAIRGSRSGLFMDYERLQAGNDVLYICEGPTDTAAAITLGLVAIGRPSCQGAHDLVAAVLHRFRIARVVVVADGDSPGQNGAGGLQDALPKRCASSLWIPPCKDLRTFVQKGGTRELFDCLATR